MLQASLLLFFVSAVVAVSAVSAFAIFLLMPASLLFSGVLAAADVSCCLPVRLSLGKTEAGVLKKLILAGLAKLSLLRNS
jgi:hypothetical protein